MCYRILPYLNICKVFISIYHFMGDWQSVIITLFSSFLLQEYIELHVTIFVLNWGQGKYNRHSVQVCGTSIYVFPIYIKYNSYVGPQDCINIKPKDVTKTSRVDRWLKMPWVFYFFIILFLFHTEPLHPYVCEQT